MNSSRSKYLLSFLPKKKVIFLFIFLIQIFPLAEFSPVNGQAITELPPNRQKQVDQYLEMIQIYINEGNLKQAAAFLNKTAFIYWESNNQLAAIDYFLKSAEINRKLENYNDLKSIYTNIAVIYTDMESIDKAIDYFNLSLEFRRKIGKRDEIAAGLIDLGYVQMINNNNDAAIQTLNEALDIASALNNTKLMSGCYNYLATAHKNIGNTKKSQEFEDRYKSLEQFQQTEVLKKEFEQREISNRTDIEREKLEKKRREYEFMVSQLLMKRREDSLTFTVKTTQDSLLVVEQLSRARKNEIELLNKEKKLKELEINERKAREQFQNLIIYSGAGILGLVIIITIVIFNGYKAKQKTNKLLASQNKEIAEKSAELESAFVKIEKQNIHITQSINYAQGIQQAMLPRPEDLQNLLPDSFILFKPRDIVSGDFYYFKELNINVANSRNMDVNLLQSDVSFDTRSNEEIQKIIIAAVDCTGHGVPGAFMSMVGFNLIDDTISRGNLKSSDILSKLNLGVRTTLKQDTTENRDGMDMALVVIDKKRKVIEYSGAKNPLVYIKNGELFHIKGDNNPIGGMPNKDIAYEQYEIPLDGPVYGYIFSDGFVDQFGGPDGRKFMFKKFREFLFEIHTRNMDEQREILDLTIEGWRSDKFPQLDDILVIGFKVDPEKFN